jgi:hypothetical protein
LNSGVGVVEGAGVGIVIYQLGSKIANADFYTAFFRLMCRLWGVNDEGMGRLVEDCKVILYTYRSVKEYGKQNVGNSRLRL